jgi:hypothetical protein
VLLIRTCFWFAESDLSFFPLKPWLAEVLVVPFVKPGELAFGTPYFYFDGFGGNFVPFF